MRKAIILLLALALASLFALFPDMADATLRIQAFGWIFEARQGPFILALVLVLAAYWLLRRLLLAVMAGPGQLWQVLKTGRRKKRETYLHDGLSEWVDMRGERGWKQFRRARGFLPEWADELLSRLPMSPADIPLPAATDDALLTALSARLATDTHSSHQADPAVRCKHLEAWLRVHPDAPLALDRKTALLSETGDWQALVTMLETIWQRGGNSASRAAPRLAEAYMHLAASQQEDTETRLGWLRKAHRLQPESGEIALLLGRAMQDAGDMAACRKLWMSHLERHDETGIALDLIPLLQDGAMKAYRRMEKRDDEALTPALALLRAGLAHTAGLTGLAREHMQNLLQRHPSRHAWQMLGGWHVENGHWKEAAEAFRKAAGSGQEI